MRSDCAHYSASPPSQVQLSSWQDSTLALPDDRPSSSAADTSQQKPLGLVELMVAELLEPSLVVA